MIFANENFQRDSKHLLANMRSTTAERARREQKEQQSTGYQDMPADESNKQKEPVGTGAFGRSSPSTVIRQAGGQVALREDVLALLASSESALSRPIASAHQSLQQYPFGGGGDMSVFNTFPFLANVAAAQQHSVSQQSQSSLMTSLLMLAAKREPTVPFLQAQFQLPPRVNYPFDPNFQPPQQQNALVAYMQHQQNPDAAATVRQLLTSILSQSNQHQSLFYGQQSAPPGST